MAFNVKSDYTPTIARHVLSKPAGKRHGISGFWVASVYRVRNERIFRMAYIPDRRFVLEAEIDAGGTHVMTQSRWDEYLEHVCMKLSQTHHPQPLAESRRVVQDCINRGRIVVSFRNARAITGDAGETGRNPVWYTPD